MSNLFVEETIEIDALPFKVWDVLTKPEFTSLWAPEFNSGAPLRIESDWRIGAPVVWKNERDQVIVEGDVTGLEPEKQLRFTVFDVRSVNRPPVTEQDGITFELAQQGGRTLLHLRQGDFSAMDEAEKYRQASAEIWRRVLPRIKQLSERSLKST
jgi:uncharacterized protein YndB with AHSA1/START domain